LVKLLGHPHRQVRMEAQLALAAKGTVGLDGLKSALKGESRLARLHAIWGLSVMARLEKAPDVNVAARHRLALAVNEADPEGRVVAAQAAVEVGDATALGLVHLLKDSDPRVCLAGALALARLPRAKGEYGTDEEIGLIRSAAFHFLAENDNRDAYL